MGLLFAGLAGYVAAEFVLAGKPHVGHWVLAAVFAVLGLLGGELWHQHREPF
jgi:hypothetical protein